MFYDDTCTFLECSGALQRGIGVRNIVEAQGFSLDLVRIRDPGTMSSMQSIERCFLMRVLSVPETGGSGRGDRERLRETVLEKGLVEIIADRSIISAGMTKGLDGQLSSEFQGRLTFFERF